jgi:hypothetical protein
MKIPTELLPLIGTLIGGLIGFVSARLLWRAQVRLQRKNLARAFLLEVRHLKRTLALFAGAFEKLPGLTEIGTPIYGRDGLYYALQKEVAAFTPEVSEALYRFYMELLEAERALQVKRDDQFFHAAAKSAQAAITEANGMLPRLEELLAREAS